MTTLAIATSPPSTNKMHTASPANSTPSPLRVWPVATAPLWTPFACPPPYTVHGWTWVHNFPATIRQGAQNGTDATVLINGTEATTDGLTARVANAGFDVEVTLDQLTAKMGSSEWDVREAYLMSDPPADSTGLFVGYLLGSDLRWSEIRWPTSGLEPPTLTKSRSSCSGSA